MVKKYKNKDEVSIQERLVYTVEEAGALLNLSRATAYMFANDGTMPAIRLGKRRIVIPKTQFHAWLDKSISKAQKE